MISNLFPVTCRAAAAVGDAASGLAGLALAPFLFPGARSLNVAATICVFVVLVASYDLLLGYTGIVSFAHTMFYGIGAYGVGLALHGMGPTWGAVLVGTVACPGRAGPGAGDRPVLAARDGRSSTP
jgi:ABC-type branched-subunit amino acid transport system permease subunit